MDIVANEEFTTLFGDTHQQKIQGEELSFTIYLFAYNIILYIII